MEAAKTWILVSDDPDDSDMLRNALNRAGDEDPEIEHILSAQWTRLGAKRPTNLIALVPSAEVLRALDRPPTRVPNGLLSRNWNKKTGLLLQNGTWTRIGFAL